MTKKMFLHSVSGLSRSNLRPSSAIRYLDFFASIILEIADDEIGLRSVPFGY